ncbi:MAG: YihY family inner membrane protein [Lentisphaerae bacterium]|nr:YihY family inner membrane protein [Lentisphaerota bacterium]
MANNENELPRSLFQRLWHFIGEGIWDVELSSMSRARRIGINAIRIVQLVLRGVRENNCFLHASALTYNSLLAIVPILALALSLLRGFGAGEIAEQRIRAAVSTMPEQFQEFIDKILAYVGHTNFTAIGGIGLIMLLWVVVQMLGSVEDSFNTIWGVKVPRRMLRKFSDYLSVVVIVPVLVIGATTINAALTSTNFVRFVESHYGIGTVITLYLQLLAFAPALVVCVAFMFLYKFIPNTHVRFLPALVSGIVGGSLWIGWQNIYIALQVGVASYGAIYATFASVPIFLAWLYMSWLIVLLGAEIGFALQNVATYRLEQRSHSASIRSRLIVALSVLSHAAQALLEAKAPTFAVPDYARKHGIPVRLINEVVDELVEAGFLAPVAESDASFVLAQAPERIKVKAVLDLLIGAGASPQSLGLENLNPAIRQVLTHLDADSSRSLSDWDIASLLQLNGRLSAPAPGAPPPAT